MADIGSGAATIVRNGRNNNGDATRRIAFVLNFFVIDVAQLTRRFRDGALDVFVRHIVGFRFCDYIAKLAVDSRITAAVADSDRDFATDFRKNLAALSVGLALFVFNICPLGMA